MRTKKSVKCYSSCGLTLSTDSQYSSTCQRGQNDDAEGQTQDPVYIDELFLLRGVGGGGVVPCSVIPAGCTIFQESQLTDGGCPGQRGKVDAIPQCTGAGTTGSRSRKKPLTAPAVGTQTQLKTSPLCVVGNKIFHGKPCLS